MANDINCPACLEDIMRADTCKSTKSGVVVEFLYAFMEDVQTWPEKIAANLRTSLDDHIVTASGSNMYMKPGKRFFRIVAKKDNVELTYEIQGESGSRTMKCSLQSYIPGLRAKILGFMSAVKNAEIVVLAKTKSGEWHMIGDEDEGAEIDTGTATSGKVGTDPNGADVTFSCSVDAPTIYMGDVDHLLTVAGTPATITHNNETISGTGATATVTLSATVTDNDSVVSKVGFRYKAEGTTDWTNVSVGSHQSGSPFTNQFTPGAAGDYLYYAYMVVDGHEVYTETYAFTIPA